MKAHASLGPGIRVPPPILYAAALVAGLVLSPLWPLSPLPGSWGNIVGSVLIVASALIMPPVLLRFRRAGTAFDVRKATSALITDGPYRFSRNPAYVSLTLLYIGLGFVLNNGWILLFAVPILVAMDLWVVRAEERHLEAKFGNDYLRYKANVRRWL